MPEKEKRGSTSLALKAGFWYVLSNFLIKGIAFITTPIFSRLMSETQYGEFSNFASWQTTLFLITGAELYSTLNRAYYDYQDKYDEYVSSITILSFVITALCYGLFMLCGEAIYRVISIPPEYIHLLFVFLSFQACKEIFMAREKTLYRYKSVAAMTAVNLVVPTAIAVIAVLLSAEGQRLSARIYGFYIPSAMVGAFCGIILLKKARKIRWDCCKYAIKLSVPLLLHFLTAYLLTASNTIVAKSVLSAEAAAMVSITTSAVHILTILLQAVSGAVTTWLMDNLEQKNYAALRRNLIIYVAGISVVAIGVILLGPEVIWILGGTKYAQAVTLLPGMVAAVTIQSITTVFTIILTYQKKVVGSAVCTAIVALGAVVAKIFMLPVYGIQILPWINVAAFGVLFVCNYLLVCKHNCGHVINFKGFCGIILLIGLVTVISGYLYANTVLRYGIIVVIGLIALLVLFRYRDMIMRLVKKKLHKE